MLVEISSATEFLVNLLRLSSFSSELNHEQLVMFRGSLSNVLQSRYREHWFPLKPNKGSAYRCIRINNKMDPVIAQAGAAIGIPPEFLRKMFPCELTVWIDPSEVSYRIGEHGSICTLYESKKTKEESLNFPPPRQSPELYHDPRQYEQVDPMVDYIY
ncbi:protein BTG2-like [Macrosteles quadrilineatus]|uniref:protein BTG2-like n=1 Tax=Macrosteles quadrilineatus TaxID=74068 RepID=UPI0023E263CD|nr:protein BTG2-like [Macrosteles quadrilineatus]XP_054280342.1 protein BTG2-like [Macrosteles quadrilineatus]